MTKDLAIGWTTVAVKLAEIGNAAHAGPHRFGYRSIKTIKAGVPLSEEPSREKLVA